MANNDKLKVHVLSRMKRVGNPKVTRYVKGDFIEKVDQTGDFAGAWMESLETQFGELEAKPQGLMKDFKDEDFSDLFFVLFGYKRSA
jgi:hypothetical protein